MHIYVNILIGLCVIHLLGRYGQGYRILHYILYRSLAAPIIPIIPIVSVVSVVVAQIYWLVGLEQVNTNYLFFSRATASVGGKHRHALIHGNLLFVNTANKIHYRKA